MTAASLSVWGTEPELQAELMISVMSEEIAGRQSLTRLDGMGSRTEEELLIPTEKLDSSALREELSDKGRRGLVERAGRWSGCCRW